MLKGLFSNRKTASPNNSKTSTSSESTTTSSNTTPPSSPPTSPPSNTTVTTTTISDNGNNKRLSGRFEIPIGVQLKDVIQQQEAEEAEEKQTAERGPAFRYTTDGTNEAIDPILDILKENDTYITSGQFIKIKNSTDIPGVQSKEVVLLFCKEAIYNIKMRNDLRKQHQPTTHDDPDDGSDVNDGSFGTVGGSYTLNFTIRRRRSSSIALPVLRGSGNLRISANYTTGFSGVSPRKRPVIGWRIPLNMIHSIEASIHFTNMFVVHYFDANKTKVMCHTLYRECILNNI
jgi:hypothetical protein